MAPAFAGAFFCPKTANCLYLPNNREITRTVYVAGDFQMTLSGKLAVITGSTSGIGLGIARAVAGAGADVVLNSFTNTDDDLSLIHI